MFEPAAPPGTWPAVGSLPSLPEVVGDPAGMRALAGTLKSLAQQVADQAASVAKTTGSISFEGPAATRFSHTIGLWETDVTSAAQELITAASVLETSATQVEAEQQARARILHQLLEDQLHDR
jgi:uncharacterized protein YukE